jgi:hypothetical protein
MFRIIDWIERLCERIYYGPVEDCDPELMQALDRMFGYAPDPWLEDYKKKEQLNRELENAEWILEYEKRLINLQKKTAAHQSKAEHAGINTERLRKLEHHLEGLRRNLSLD